MCLVPALSPDEWDVAGVVEAIRGRDTAVTLTDIADRTGLPRSTVHRMLEQPATAFADSLETVFLQDVPIWRHKTRIDNPLLCEEDGPVYQLRRWYQQFYVDVEDITPDMTNRYEFEVDVTRAVQAWKAEVADNIAQGRTLDMSGANNA